MDRDPAHPTKFFRFSIALKPIQINWIPISIGMTYIKKQLLPRCPLRPLSLTIYDLILTIAFAFLRALRGYNPSIAVRIWYVVQDGNQKLNATSLRL